MPELIIWTMVSVCIATMVLHHADGVMHIQDTLWRRIFIVLSLWGIVVLKLAEWSYYLLGVLVGAPYDDDVTVGAWAEHVWADLRAFWPELVEAWNGTR